MLLWPCCRFGCSYGSASQPLLAHFATRFSSRGTPKIVTEMWLIRKLLQESFTISSTKSLPVLKISRHALDCFAAHWLGSSVLGEGLQTRNSLWSCFCFVPWYVDFICNECKCTMQPSNYLQSFLCSCSTSGAHHMPSGFMGNLQRTNKMPENEFQINDVKLSPDSKHLYCAASTYVKIWDLNKCVVRF